MIRFLSIQHLAVIDALELDFDAGFTVLTGETGAGKSIVVEALGLLVGGRASPELVRTGEDHATIQGIFETPEGRELVVRREIFAQGRSRAFIDDALATSGALKELGARLVDLHGQHEHQTLLDPRTHLDLVDEYGRLGQARAEVAERFARWRTLGGEVERLRAADRDRATRADLVRFQLAEIDRVAPRPGEDAELQALRQVLANAERLERLCRESYRELYEGDEAALARLSAVWRKVAELATVEPRFAPYLEVRDQIKAHLEDLAYFLRSYGASIDASPERLHEVEERLTHLERLKRKYGPALADVLARREALVADLRGLETTAARLADAVAEEAAAREAYLDAARRLSEARRVQARHLTRRLEAELAELAMARTRCEVRFIDGDGAEAAWSERGIDQAELFLSPNPGEELRPLARIVSGGELSRIMLALKTLATTDAPGKTLVFDEVDAGIGGRVAEVVGLRLRRLAQRFQVFCITHLPQIAAWGDAHYRITKSVRSGRTVTRAERLEGEARVEELARLMAGTQVSDRVRASARELLQRQAKGEENTKGESETSPARRRP